MNNKANPYDNGSNLHITQPNDCVKPLTNSFTQSNSPLPTDPSTTPIKLRSTIT